MECNINVTQAKKTKVEPFKLKTWPFFESELD